MIKTYWKQLLVTFYIAVVLILSATAKANSEIPDPDVELLDLEKRLESLMNQSEPAVFAKSSIVFEKNTPLVKSFEDTGSFMFDSQTGEYVFESSISRKIYVVKLSDELKAEITSDEVYVVKGFDFSDSLSAGVRPPDSSPQDFSFTNSKDFIFVTGVEIQS